MKSKYFNLIIEILFLALVFLAPVIFDRRIGIVFSLTKATYIRFFTLIILMIWTFKLIIRKEHPFVSTKIDWLVLSFVLICAAATITSVHPYTSFFGFYGRFEGFITWLNFGLLFFITTNYIRSFESIKRIFVVVMTAGAVMAVYSILQRFHLDPYAWGGVVTWRRVIGTIGQPNFLAAYMNMAFFAALALLLFQAKRSKPSLENFLPSGLYFLTIFLFFFTIYVFNGINPFPWHTLFILMTVSTVFFAFHFDKIFYLLKEAIIFLSLILIYIALFYTQSRGGYFGFAVGAVLFAVITPRKNLFENLHKLAFVFLGIMIVTFITIKDPAFSPFARFMGEVKFEKQEEILLEEKGEKTQIEFRGAAGSRTETWKSAFNMIADYPLLGIGPEVLKMVFPHYETELFRFKEAFHVKQDRCHNETFDVPVTKGLFGFFVFFGILGSVFYLGIRKEKTLSIEDRIVNSAALSAIASYIIQNQFSFGVVAIVSLFWILWAIVLIVGNYSSFENDKKIEFSEIPIFPILIVFIITSVLVFVSAYPFVADKYFKAGKSLSEMKRWDYAIPNLNKSLKVMPYEGSAVTHLGIAYLNGSRLAKENREKYLDKSEEILRYGILIDPYNADNFHILSRIRLMRKKIMTAEDLALKALKIDPYYAEAYLTLAEIADKREEKADSLKFYKKAAEINPTLYQAQIRIGWALIEENKLNEAFEIFQELLISKPQNIDVHNALATIYFKQGNLTAAKSELEQSLFIDPNNKYAKKLQTWLK